MLQLFAWQRYAEISADRAGVVCAGGLDPASRALFKLASGLRGGRVRVRIDQFMAQVGDLRDEAARLEGAEEAPRPDWFATHPFSPLRLQAVTLFAKSELMAPGGLPAASETVNDKAIAELERLLGPGSVPYEVKPEVIRKDLPSRIEAVNRSVPRLRRTQVVRDLCVIARADGHIREAELRVMHEIAAAIGVDPGLVDQTVCGGPACH